MDMTTNSLANAALIRQYLAQRISSREHPLCMWTDYDHPARPNKNRINNIVRPRMGVYISIAGPMSKVLALRLPTILTMEAQLDIGNQELISTAEAVQDPRFLWHKDLEPEFDTPTLLRKNKGRKEHGDLVAYSVNFFAGIEILQTLAVICHGRSQFREFALKNQIF